MHQLLAFLLHPMTLLCVGLAALLVLGFVVFLILAGLGDERIEAEQREVARLRALRMGSPA